MKDSKLGYTKFVEDSKLKEVEFYKEPKPGCPGFIKNPTKCKSKDIPEWGL